MTDIRVNTCILGAVIVFSIFIYVNKRFLFDISSKVTQLSPHQKTTISPTSKKVVGRMHLERGKGFGGMTGEIDEVGNK